MNQDFGARHRQTLLVPHDAFDDKAGSEADDTQVHGFGGRHGASGDGRCRSGCGGLHVGRGPIARNVQDELSLDIGNRRCGFATGRAVDSRHDRA